MIQEPTLECYFYFLRRIEGDTLQAAQERRLAFEQELRALFAHLQDKTGQTISFQQWAEEDNSRRVSQLLLSTGWLNSTLRTGLSCFAAAYIYGDVYCLQTGYGQSGEAGSEVFAHLRQSAWEPSTVKHVLGTSNYLCGITSGEERMLAAEVLSAFTGTKPSDVTSTRFSDTDALLYGVLEQPFISALFYPNAECEAQAGEVILNNRAPRLEVYKHKIDRQLAWCAENCTILAAQGSTLVTLLGRSELHQLPSDKTLAHQLARHLQVYERNLEMLSERQTTIETNLHNLAVVLGEFGTCTEDYLLEAVQERLWERRAQLEETLDEATRIQVRAETEIRALTARLGLKCPADLLEQVEASTQAEALIGQGGFPGVLPPYESELPFPAIEVAHGQVIELNDVDINILQHIYRGYKKLTVLKEFHGGTTSRHTLLTRPIGQDGYEKALRVTKIGSALELLIERNNYRQYVGDTLPFFTAPLEWERYYAESDLAGLSYLFVGGGGLGETMELEEYYRQAQADQNQRRLSQTLSGLLDRELGKLWYGKFHSQPDRSFEAEYGPDLFEHLRLRLRSASPDTIWISGARPNEEDAYQSIEVTEIPARYHTLPPGSLLKIEGLTVTKIKHGIVKLQDQEGLGIVVRVEFGSQSDLLQGLTLNHKVGFRGELVFNRHGRMEESARRLFPSLVPGAEKRLISLPGVPGTFPNPLHIYPVLLKRNLLQCRKSYVHGDLHMRNVLVDGWGIGRLIDFAEVSERHNLFDFIRLEGYLRYLTLGSVSPRIPLQEYIEFEESLMAATLGKNAFLLQNPHLRFARETILAIRRIARNYLADETDLLKIYLPALFLHCLVYLRYDQKTVLYGIQLTFATACVLARELSG